jgi:spore germination cell wall hydrolase CwlJ-like protein
VADVIIHRVDDPEYPDGIREVIEQKGQFAVVGNGTIRTTTPTEETWRAVFLEAAGERVDSEIIFFNCGGYLSCGEPWEKVGDHYFSTKGD